MTGVGEHERHMKWSLLATHSTSEAATHHNKQAAKKTSSPCDSLEAKGRAKHTRTGPYRDRTGDFRICNPALSTESQFLN